MIVEKIKVKDNILEFNIYLGRELGCSPFNNILRSDTILRFMVTRNFNLIL